MMRIGDHNIGVYSPPYIIAEISANHTGRLDVAQQLITAAYEAGADAVKFQCYTADTITLDSNEQDFIVKHGLWQGRRLYDLYNEAHTPWDWFPLLFEHARNKNITMFASVFDITSVEYMEQMGCPAYKIASMEIVDVPLIQRTARTGKPMIISTGMATLGEIQDAVTAAAGVASLALLHCVSGYPTDPHDANLRRIDKLRHWKHAEVGISDHTLGWEIPCAATALGVTIVEKHLTLSRAIASEDAEFSLEPAEFQHMANSVRAVWEAMRGIASDDSEWETRQLRRSLYVVEDVQAGEAFTVRNVRSIRPSYGLPPKDLHKVLGLRAARGIKRGTALAWDLIASQFPEAQVRLEAR